MRSVVAPDRDQLLGAHIAVFASATAAACSVVAADLRKVLLMRWQAHPVARVDLDLCQPLSNHTREERAVVWEQRWVVLDSRVAHHW